MTFVQDSLLAFDLIRSSALLALGALGYCALRHRLRGRLPWPAESVVYGLVFASVGVFEMLAGIQFGTGIHLDLRIANLAITTIFAGLEAGLVVTLIFVILNAAIYGPLWVPMGLLLGTGFILSATFVLHLRRRRAEADEIGLTVFGSILGASLIALAVAMRLPVLPPALVASAGPVWFFMAVGTIVLVGATIIHVERSNNMKLALLNRESEFRAIMDNAPIAMFLKDRDGNFQMVNRCFQSWYGVNAADARDKAYVGDVAQDHAEFIHESDAAVVRDGRTVSNEHRTQVARPGIETVLVTKVPVRDERGQVIGIAGFVLDITERKRTDTLLRESRERLLEALRIGRVGYMLYDVSTDRVEGSDSAISMLGAPQGLQLTFEEALRYIHPDDRAHFLKDRTAALAEGRDYSVKMRMLHTDGSVRWAQIVAHPRFDATGKLESVFSFLRDITDTQRAEEALRQNEERFRALIEHSNDVLLVLQPSGRLTYRSPSATEVLGYDAVDLIGRSVLDRLHPDDVTSFAKMLDTIAIEPGRRATGRSRVRHEDGSWRHLSWSARNATDVPGVDGIIINSRDVTDALRLEGQLLQAQKMEAVGQLAGGIAHDFNNLLGAIRGFAGFLQQDLPTDSPQSGFAGRIINACDRGRELVQQILAFARQGGNEHFPSDLARIVPETLELLRAAIPNSRRLEMTGVTSELTVDVNPAQIAQILLNLCLNASDAIGIDAGTISIDVAGCDPRDGNFADLDGGSSFADGARVVSGTLDRSRSYAQIKVADTGVGMNEAVLARIFDPFFTTKERGRGTGLGLSVVHGIIVECGGACEVASRPGSGTVFTVYLPIASHLPSPAEWERPSQPRAGHERLLVVDDEVDISDVLTIGLDRLGYEVVAVKDALDAVAAFAEAPDAWDLVICDHVMPGLSGLGVLRQMRSLRPTIPFILCTGFSNDVSESTALAQGVDAFIRKPVAIEQLATTIRELLDADDPSAADRSAASAGSFGTS
jgi:PAS domain S-box-containing protein